jgi:hypothetical protein
MEKFVLGIPTGRLEMFCLSQLKSIGIEIKDSPQINRKYRIAVRHSLITDVLFVKPADICPAIHEGMLDVGFSGSDCYDEFHLRTGKHLYFSEKEKTTDNENCSSRICLIGRVGVGLAKGRDVQQSIQKAYHQAKKNLVTLVIKDGTIPYQVEGKYSSAAVILKPSKSGIKAGGAVRVVAQMAGIAGLTGKLTGRTNNKINIARATMVALGKIRAGKLKFK